LELELKTQKQHPLADEQPIQQIGTPPTVPINSSTPEKRDPETSDRELLSLVKRPCEGIHLRTARSKQKTWYGSSSLFYFIGRINAFLTTTFHQDFSAQGLLPNAASKLLDAPTTVSGEHNSQGSRRVAAPIDDSIHTAEYLTPTQEEYFLDLFWQSYYTTYPILDEFEFKEYYRSLWSASSKEREPSALVDIVLAVCMQFGVSQLPDAGRGHNGVLRAKEDSNDATIAGRWHYRRCQTLLSSELESPTMSTLQCHLLSCLYLCNASFMNMADHACSQAVRTAYMLGLHLEPPQTMPRRDRELQKRLWWSVFVQETKMSMKLGRPFLLYDSSSTCTPPADDRDTSVLSGPDFASPGESVTWLTWSLHSTKLMLAARAAYTAFFHYAANDSRVGSGEGVIERLNEWLKGVPEALRLKRQNNGEPLSTDLSALEIEQFAPMWLQRQRLLLELLYHHLCTNLHRPSISFPSGPAPIALPDTAATECAAHAMALTHIMHQVLLSTFILAGWIEAFQWQWNAAMTLVGFILAYPQCPSTPAARNAIDLSIAVFEKFGDSFAVAVSSADIMRGLSTKVDMLMESRRMHDLSVHQDTTINDDFATQSMNGLQGFDGQTTAEITGVLGQSIDILAAEPYSDFDWSGVDASFPDLDIYTTAYLES
jgi:hypothetical protein